MKKRINIMLGEEAVAALEQIDNNSAYIEKLILEADTPTPHELTEGRVSYLLTQQTQEIIDSIKNIALPTANREDMKMAYNPDMQTLMGKPLGDVLTATPRTKSIVKQEIDQMELNRKEVMESVQDEQALGEIHKQYQATIDGLWREFHSL